MLTLKDWLADRQRLFNVMQNVFKLRKLQFESNSDSCVFITYNEQSLDEALQIIASLGFKERDGRDFKSESLNFSKAGMGYIHSHYDYVVAKIEVKLGLKQSYKNDDIVARFERNQKKLLESYKAESFIDLLGTINHEPNNEQKEKNGQALIADLRNVGFEIVPKKYRENTEDRTLLLYQDGLFIHCDYREMFVWSNQIFN